MRYRPSNKSNSVLELLLPGDSPVSTLMALFGLGFYALLAVQTGDAFSFQGFPLLRSGGNRYELTFAAGEYWRLLSYGLLHGGLIHIAFNTYVLVSLGSRIEERIGPGRLAIIYVLSCILGGVVSAFTSPGTSVGASGAVMGIFGAGIVLLHFDGTSTAMAYRNHLLVWTGIIFFLGIFAFSGVDNGAHLGGLLGGAGVGYLFSRNERPSATQRRIEGVAGTILILAMVGSAVGHQIYVRDVPTIAGASDADIQAARYDLWQQCREALADGDLDEAGARCFAYRTFTLDEFSTYLMSTVHELRDEPRRAALEHRLTVHIRNGSPPVYDDLDAEDRLALLVRRIDQIQYR